VSTEGLPGLYQQNFSPETLRLRRLRVGEAIGASAMALVQGAALSGAMALFRQSNEMYYLTGVEVPNAYILIVGETGHSTLYLEHRDAGAARGEGERLNADDPESVVRLTGVDAVSALEQLPKDLWRMSWKSQTPTLLTPFRPAEGAAASRDSLLGAVASSAGDPWADTSTREATFADRLRGAFPGVAVSDLSPVLDRLREVKDSSEIDLLRVAGRLTAVGVLAAMRGTAPGMHEYQLAAIANYVFSDGGARSEGYRAIVGGGTNAWHGHYGRQCDPLQDGDLVLMDHAADYAYYTSDIGRVWPVNGTYTDAQRTLYGFIVEYHRELLSRTGPGISTNAVMDHVAQVMEKRINEIKWSFPHHEAAARGALAFRGHYSHPVGMAVHDVGDYRDRPVEVGAVFALDPMIWIPEERLYIRCEDTIVITSDGYENVTELAPLDCDEIEAAMADDGILDVWDPGTGTVLWSQS